MRKIIISLCVIASLLAVKSAFAIISLELTRGISGAIPIAVVPFSTENETLSQNVSSVIANDLQNSGRFKVFAGNRLTQFPSQIADIPFPYFRKLGTDNIVIGKIEPKGVNQYQVSFQLLEVLKGKESGTSAEQMVLLDHKYTVPQEELRSVAHHISDLIYQKLTGIRGIFSTRLAYIVVQRGSGTKTRYILEVSDQDGYNPRPLLISNDPIMSPAWSPNGKQIAYVSFEKKHAAIYIEDVATGSRRLISEFIGINGAPAFSPDGKKLALVLSKSGSPNLYTMDLASRQLTQLTDDFYINTEPAWSPDGGRLIFTSNRSGNPQIYQMDLATKQVTRLTYDGKYNARAAFTPDGNHIVVLNQQEGMFNIGTLNLDSGLFRVLTNSGTDNESPSMAPNGSMILFGTLHQGRSVLGMVATDGSVLIRLPAREGEVQDPAWSP